MCISAVSALLLLCQIKFHILISKKFSVSVTECIVSGIAKEVMEGLTPRVATRRRRQNGGDNGKIWVIMGHQAFHDFWGWQNYSLP